jgi:hypothetical protein
VECGHSITSEQHCKNLKCEKCGGQMRRKERPGPGKEDANDNGNTAGAASDCAPQAGGAGKPADEPDPAAQAEARGYERGKLDAAAECERTCAAKLAEVSVQLERRDALIRQHQSARDKAERTIASEAVKAQEREAALNAQINDLTKSLSDANAHVGRVLGGGMVFSPASPETWEEAMRLCGDYETAAKKYPELRKEFIRRNTRK